MVWSGRGLQSVYAAVCSPAMRRRGWSPVCRSTALATGFQSAAWHPCRMYYAVYKPGGWKKNMLIIVK